MDLPINNINDLRDEIARLKGLEQEQGVALAKRFSSPSAAFSSVLSIFPKSSGEEGSGGFFHQDFVGLLSRIVLPFTLNKTLFRNSNFIVKTLVGLVSQKASHFISEDSVVGVWDKVKSIFKKKEPKEEPPPVAVKPVSGTA